jgi:hypothetical protein
VTNRVNFKKLRPRAPILKGSKVLEELQHIATAEPERVQELKRTSTFLQKPQRPVPKLRDEQKTEKNDGETYKVVIKKQDKKTVIARLVEKGLLPPGSEANVIKTPEPPAFSEVKMHEMKNGPEKERLSVMSDPNSPCTTFLDINAAELDSYEMRPSEDQSMYCSACAKCEPKLFHVKPSHCRKSSYNSKYNETESSLKAGSPENGFHNYVCSCTLCDKEHLCSRSMPSQITISRTKRTRMKGKYLTTYLQRESIRLISLIMKLFEFFLQKSDAFESSSIPDIRRRRSSFKGHYLENVLQRNVGPVLECVKETYFINDPKMIDMKKDESKSTEMKEQNHCLKFILNFMDYAKNRLAYFFSTSSKVRRGFKGRYFERFVRRNIKILELFVEYIRSSTSEWFANSPSCTSRKEFPVVSVITSNCIADDSTLNIGKYDECIQNVISEWHEDGPSCPLQRKSSVSFSNEEKINEYNYNDVLDCSDLVATGEIDERAILSKFTDKMPEEEDNLSKFLQSAENYISAEVFHRGSRRLSRPRKSVDVTSEEDDNALEKFLQSAENYVSAEIFHRGNRRLSKSRKSIDIIPEKDDNTLEKFLQSAENYVSAEIFHRGNRRFSKSRNSTDMMPEADDNTLEKLLRSAENYISAEVFHRRSRRLSKPRKSIDIVPEGNDNALEKFLRSAEDYVSTEVFHRGSRRFSKSRKSIDIVPEKDNNALKGFLQSAENYVTAEVFHRGNRRFSKSRKSIDITSEEDDNALEKLLRSAEDYVSSEVFHRGSRRLSRPRKSIDIMSEGNDNALEKLLRSAEDYVSAEVFHRGSRRLSRSKDAGQESGVSSLLRSTGDYVSSEVFHRKSRRLSRSSRRESISLVTPTWWSTLKSINLPWFSLGVTKKNLEYNDVYEEKLGKMDSMIDSDNRRLSFVPTILYQGITNCIGIDFTKLVAYAFVPCTTIILLYMYK